MASEYIFLKSLILTQLQAYLKPSLVVVAILVITAADYAVTCARYNKSATVKSNGRKPPLVPHFIPFIGHIPWQYAWSPISFFTSGLFFKELYIIQGRENVIAHLAQTSTSNTIFNAAFLRQACAMSKKAVGRMGSEGEETPRYFERKYLAAAPLYAWSSSVIHRYLAGRSAFQLSQRFETILGRRIQAHPAIAVREGVMLEDFLDFFSNDVTAALLDAMCGEGLLKRNPHFTSAFWTFCDNLPTYMKQVPRFLARPAYDARDKVLAAVINWQAWASTNFDETTPLDANGDDPFWGSQFFRERFSTFVYKMGFDAQDVASMELGFLFGASANVTVNTYWCAIDVFKDQDLLRDVRKEVQACKLVDKGGLRFDIGKLVQQPLLQAVFAESLRLRCHNMFIRKTTEVIKIQEWMIPKDQFVIAWSTPGQMDSRSWGDSNGEYPMDTFWPGRFLKYDEDTRSLQFSLVGLEGSWLPFGSGANLCPGRHFAKIHCMLTLAMMVESFDCDILVELKDLKIDTRKFGMGVLSPSGKVPVRIRQREG